MGFRQLLNTWNALGRIDPLWAILSHPEKRGNRWQLDEFLDTGRGEIAAMLAKARHLAPAFGTARALDFGCGVGRLTQALGEYFAAVDGVDVAPSMVEHARRLDRHGDRCRYHLNQSLDLHLFEDASFDFACSSITLQHMQPRFVRGYLAELLRVLRPGGVLVFQLPGELRGQARSPVQRFAGRVIGRCLRTAYLLKHRVVLHEPVMDMYGIARQEAEALLRGMGSEVLEVEENEGAGPQWTSFRYFARRLPAAPA